MNWNSLTLLLVSAIFGSTSGFLSPRVHNAVRAMPFPSTATPLTDPRTTLKMMGINAVPDKRNLAIAGRIPWGKLLISKAQALQIISIVRAETHSLDLALMFFFAAFSEKIGKFYYEKISRRFRDVGYDQSVTQKVANSVGQASALGIICYCFDVFEIALEVAGVKSAKTEYSTPIAKLIFATWAALRVRLYKRKFFAATFEQTQKWAKIKATQGKVELVDKISDFFVFGILALVWIDILEIKRGNGLSSIFALGGAGTLVITLACQDLAKKVLNGFAISTSDVFSVGDQIQLGDGTAGVVRRVGWLSTELRGSDEIVTKIPNTQLSNIRVSNLSRLTRSQVKQSLRFRYEDMDKIPGLVKEIRNEIEKSCPKVITDGSRPFRVHWLGIEADHLLVMVDCRLRNPPIGNDYFDAKQGIIEAIARAAKRKGADFIPPTVLNVEMVGHKAPDTLLTEDII